MGSKISLHKEFIDNFTSPHTRESYARDIRQFFDHHVEIDTPASVTRQMVVEYRNFLGETGGVAGNPAAPKTIARKLAALSSYFDFLTERGECSFNPVTSVKRPRREVLSPTPALEVEQARELLAAIDGKTPSGALHLALLTTLFTTGMRKSEVLRLKFKDYREINQYKVVEFCGKGGRVSQKLLHPLCIEALENYLQSMREQGRAHRPEDWLFQPTRNPVRPNHLDRPLNPKTVNQILQRYGQKIGLNFKITSHTARALYWGVAGGGSGYLFRRKRGQPFICQDDSRIR